MTLSEASDTIAVDAYVTFKRSPGGPDTLSLDLIGMTVDSVGYTNAMWTNYVPYSDTARAKEKRFAPVRFSYDGRVLRLPLGKPSTVSPSGPQNYAQVAISYHGVPQDGLIERTNAYGHRVVFADNWPERARFWLATVDRPADKAWVSFAVQVPPSWKVVSNGVEDVSERPRQPGRWSWSTREIPIPTYTMVIGAGEFTVSKHRPAISGRHTIPIEVWTYPEDSAYADSVPFRRATEIVEVMQRLIGPFPYENLKHVESSTRFGGMENASAIFYAEKPYVERRMSEGVVRHETAHQWFGDAVTPRDWPHLWLSEGFATYFDGVIGAALDGDSVLTNAMHENAESYFKSDVTDRPIVDSAHASDPMKLLNANSYPKGAWVLHMLRGLVGDSAFFRGLRNYYNTYRDSTATSEDFQYVMEKSAGANLGWFFRQWLYQPGYPQLDVAWRYDGGARRLSVGITQRQKPEWGLFRLPVLTLEFRGPDGAVVRRDVAVTRRETDLRLDLPFAPTEVRVDPEGKLLLRTMAAGRR
ncbi:MAG TPA: M1 family metallopeptidase [Gemmatimonadales bacterium]|nr:M1 family metallopeptidase [Gemmatimonadales bacterium]